VLTRQFLPDLAFVPGQIGHELLRPPVDYPESTAAAGRRILGRPVKIVELFGPISGGVSSRNPGQACAPALFWPWVQ